MDKKTVFVKTSTGETEANGQSDALYGDAKRILNLVDDESTVGEISKRAPPSLRDSINDVLQELVDGGFIRDMRAPVNVPQKPALKMAAPAFKMATPRAASPTMPTPSAAISSRAAPAAVAPSRPAEAPSRAAPASSTPSRSMPDMSMPNMTMPVMHTPEAKKEEPPKVNNGTDLDFSFITSGSSSGAAPAKPAPDRAQAEAAARAAQESERLKAAQAAQIEASAQAAKLKAYEEAKEKAKFEVAMRAKIEAEARAKNEAEAARQRAEQEVLKARSELEVTKARVEAEVRARIEAETRVKQEMEASKTKVEIEMRNRIEAEARAKAEVEARVKREAEIERLRIEKERAEQEAARIKAEAEIRMRAEAEMRVRAEVEARLKREADAERLRIQNEQAQLEIARAKAEAEIRMRTDAEMRVRAEVEARLQAEALAKQREQAAAQAALSSAVFSKPAAKEEQVDPAEKLRQSFVESFGQQKKKQDATTGSFKLEQFSFANTGKMPAATTQSIKTEVPPGGGSKVKAALEQRAQKEAEAKRLQAEQEAARLKAEQDAAAGARAEQDSIRLKAEHEAYRLKVAQDEERAKAEAVRAKAEAEAQKLTNQQSRQWEEAQQRATSQAQAEKERLAQQSAAKSGAQHKSARAPRKPLPIAKMVSSLFVLALIAVAGLPYVWPLEEYIAPLEKEISAQLNQPIHISKIHLAVLPMPKLELINLTVGGRQEFKVGNAVLNFDFSALFAHTKSINNLELSNVTLAGASLDKVLVWLQAAGGIEKYPVARIELHDVRVISDEIKLPPLDGRAEFDAQGKFTRADLKDEREKFKLELLSLQNHLKLELNVHESSLPILTNIVFNDLSASGVVENGEFTFTDFFAHIHAGTLTGKGQLNWNNGWKIQGQINAKSMDLKRMFPDYVVSGELNGDVGVSLSGSALSQLDRDPHIEGVFSVKNGVINKVDIDSVARFGARQGVAGHTDFNELLGTLRSDSRGQRIYLSKISSVVVNGTGLVEVDDKQQLSGKIQVDIKGPANGNVSLQLSGTAKDPILQSGR